MIFEYAFQSFTQTKESLNDLILVCLTIVIRQTKRLIVITNISDLNVVKEFAQNVKRNMIHFMKQIDDLNYILNIDRECCQVFVNLKNLIIANFSFLSFFDVFTMITFIKNSNREIFIDDDRYEIEFNALDLKKNEKNEKKIKTKKTTMMMMIKMNKKKKKRIQEKKDKLNRICLS